MVGGMKSGFAVESMYRPWIGELGVGTRGNGVSDVVDIALGIQPGVPESSNGHPY